VLLLCALAAGIVVDCVWPAPMVAWWIAAAAALLVWILAWSARRDRVASWLLLCSVATTGAAWHHAYWRLYPSDEIGRTVDEVLRPMCVEGTAMTSPRWVPAPPPTPLRTIPQGEQSELLVWITAVRDGRDFRPASGWATLEVEGRLSDVRAGDRLRIMAQAAHPAPPHNPGEFDFERHERGRRVGCRMFAEFPEAVARQSRGGIFSWRRWVADIRDGGTGVLQRYIAPQRATLASAILLGAREQLDPHRNEDYLVTGTIHVLSISGLHVGILAAGIFFLLRLGLMPRQLTLLVTIALTVAYAVLTDMQPPVVRATILVVVACLALWMGRPAIGFNSLGLAGIVVLLFSPASLFQTGAQLSFLAVATMIAFQRLLVRQQITDPLDRLMAAARPKAIRILRDLTNDMWRLWLTGALIWLISTPLVWKQYHLISPVGLILNFVMWLPVTLAMYAGMGTLIFGSLVPLTGRLCGWACDEALEFLEWTIAAGRGWPGSYAWLAAPPTWWIALFYAALGAAAAFPALRPPRRWIIAAGLMWTAGALLLSGAGTGRNRITAANERELVCHFVAVGHGVSVLVELPDGRSLLYDAGRLGTPMSGVRPISAVLWSRGITHLDALVVSHADADHFNAIPDLLDRFSLGAIYVSPVMFEDLPPAVRELRQSIARAGVPLRELHAGQRLATGGETTIEVLHPPPSGVFGSDNANSIVLLIEHAGRRIMLTGDLEWPGLDYLLDEEPIDCDVVLAPHHGSPRSNPGGTVPLNQRRIAAREYDSNLWACPKNSTPCAPAPATFATRPSPMREASTSIN
jgi:competence protein ComEC